MTDEAGRRERETQALRHEVSEERFWARSLWISLFTGGVAVIAVVLSFLAFHETRRQADAAEQANRAWLKIAVSAHEDGWWGASAKEDHSTVRGNFVVSFENVGHQPAFDISVLAELAPDIAHQGDIERSAKEACEDHRGNQELTTGGRASIPGETGQTVERPYIARYDIDSRRRIYDASPTNLKLPPHKDLYTLTTCVRYRIQGDDKVHLSVRVFRLRGKADLWLPTLENVSKDRLVIEHFFYGEYDD